MELLPYIFHFSSIFLSLTNVLHCCRPFSIISLSRRTDRHQHNGKNSIFPQFFERHPPREYPKCCNVWGNRWLCLSGVCSFSVSVSAVVVVDVFVENPPARSLSKPKWNTTFTVSQQNLGSVFDNIRFHFQHFHASSSQLFVIIVIVIMTPYSVVSNEHHFSALQITTKFSPMNYILTSSPWWWWYRSLCFCHIVSVCVRMCARICCSISLWRFCSVYGCHVGLCGVDYWI